MIEKKMFIEDLIEELPESVTYLMQHGIKCIACGEPIWGTLKDAAKEKGFGDEAIDKFVNELNNLKKEYGEQNG